MEKGILYIATGEDYIEEAKRSARQTRSVVDYPIAIISDREIECALFDKVLIDEEPQYKYFDTVRNLSKSPFEKTLYIDTDVYILDAIDELFQLLEYFDLAAAIDPNEAALRLENIRYFEDLPESVPEYNCGVLLYDENTDMFFEKWEKEYSPKHYQDQVSFRKAIAETDINFSSISPIYNCFLDWPMQITGEVKIVHDLSGRITDNNLNSVISRINRTTSPRILHSSREGVAYPLSGWGDMTTRLLWRFNPIVVIEILKRTQTYRLSSQFIYNLYKEGLIKTLKETIRFIRE